jgi:hypothetical protein
MNFVTEEISADGEVKTDAKILFYFENGNIASFLA